MLDKIGRHEVKKGRWQAPFPGKWLTKPGTHIFAVCAEADKKNTKSDKRKALRCFIFLPERLRIRPKNLRKLQVQVAVVFLIFTRLRSLRVFPLYSFRQFHDPNGEVARPHLVVECTGANNLISWKQTMPFCVSNTGIQRPLAFSNLCGHPRHEHPTGRQLMGFPGAEPIGPIHHLTKLGTVARSTPSA